MMNPLPTATDYHSRPLPTTPDRGYAVAPPRVSTRRDPPPVPSYRQPSGSSSSSGRGMDDACRRELEEARARTAQMEKTMRWWSDCTANWREKWSRAREERNRARDECRRLRAEVDAATTDRAALVQHRDELVLQVKDLESILRHRNPLDTNISSETCHESSNDSTEQTIDQQFNVDDLPLHSSVNNSRTNCSEVSVAEVCKQLDEARIVIGNEQREKEELNEKLNELKMELANTTIQRDDYERAHGEAKAQIEKLRKWKRDRVEQMASDLEDDAMSGSDMDRRLADLRRELEKIQAENAQEWALREKLSSEKLALERENKRMRSDISHLEEEIRDRTRPPSAATADFEMKTLQDELAHKTKELAEVRHAHTKLKKSLQERGAELEHARSRAEQYEAEVKKLRSRIEELKSDLATVEDESDQQSNQVRRLQRTNDELQQQVDSLTIQMQHLQTRLSHRKSSSVAGSAENSSEDIVAAEVSENDEDHGHDI